jgi:NAD(P)-dependent dehydrogenase (short-subunit alcohol dehydrogenase family)
LAHPVLSAGAVAVITGGAAGIGLAAATRFAQLGLRVCIADLGEEHLSAAAATRAAAAPEGERSVLAQATAVGRADDLQRLESAVRERFGGVDVLMNNAGIQPGSGMFGPAESWQGVLGVNLWGVINGTQVFVPGMIERGRPGLVINTGSKQGIPDGEDEPRLKQRSDLLRTLRARPAIQEVNRGRERLPPPPSPGDSSD